MSSTSFKAWFLLFRPWSVTATLVPFLVAAALGSAEANLQWLRWSGGLFAGILFQATVNLLNTWGDEKSGVDNVPGAIRTTPQVHDGLVSLRSVLVVGLACAFLAATIGLLLCFQNVNGNWIVNIPLLAAGFVGFLGSTNYSTGVKFKYHGLGVPFVSFLMGPLEIFVALQIFCPEAFTPLQIVRVLLFALPIAALVGVIMHGNDMRDIPTDRAAGIVTLASRLGPSHALAYYVVCHIFPHLFCLVWAIRSSWHALIPLLVLPLSVKTIRTATRIYRQNPLQPKWIGLERASGGIHFLFGILYAVSLALVTLTK